MGQVLDIRRGTLMADKLDEMSRVIGSVEKGQAAIEATLNTMDRKLDEVLPLVNDHDKRLTSVEASLKPLVEAHNRRVWVGLGWFAGAGTLASSPLWVTKLLPFLAALPK